MAESSTERTSQHAFEKVRGRTQVIRGWAEQTLLWKVWDRMLETEFIDRSIALAGKAFISFFPLIIVVAAFMPAHLRMSIFTTVTHRLGITGASLGTVKQAFASAISHDAGQQREPARTVLSGQTACGRSPALRASASSRGRATRA